MKLEEFKEKDKKKQGIYIGIGVVVVLLAVALVIQSFALYEEKKSFDVIKGKVPEYMSDYDVNLAVTIDGVSSNTIPEKGTNKVVSSILCDKDAKAFWDYEKWMIVVDFKNTRTKCKVNFISQYSDDILKGTDPVLADVLIPITIDNSGVVRKADLASKWYDYGNKEWANAVILSDKTESYENNEVIPENKIESYFVWIPRYKYKIFNDGNYTSLTAVEKREQEIELEFENKDMVVSNGSTVGTWLTHPAFTSFNTNGMWVGKFETGYKGATTSEEAESNKVDVSKVIVKPNVYSWRNINVSNAHLNSYNYQRNLDSHMMKNTEWGAVAYLSHSKYGGKNSVRINNNSGYVTGYAAKNEPTCGYTGSNGDCNVYEAPSSLGDDGTNTYNYFNVLSKSASTTGNKSGVYDMSGGAWEYVMGVMLDSGGNLVSGVSDIANSNFIGTLTNPSVGNNKNKTSWTTSDGGIPYPESKYYDIYAYATDKQHFNYRILGDATGEMGPFANVKYGSRTNPISSWYGDLAYFVQYEDPFLFRGSDFHYGNGAGIFNFATHYGFARSDMTFRLVLSF